MNATLRTALAVLLIGVITVCAVLITGRLAGRSRLGDLTEHRLHTLSDGTKQILAKLNQPITLKLYYSRVAARKGPEQIRYWNNYYLYVRDLLEEYASRSKGKLRLEIVDPRPFSEDEEEAIRYGVRRFQLSQDESFFFGLVALTELGKDKVIEFFEPDRQEFIEYDLSKIIGELMQRDKLKIGVISSLPVTGTDMSPYMMQMLRMQGREPEAAWTVIEHLRQTYDVASVEVKDAAIPDDVDFLMVIHPKALDEPTLFAIDQYVMKGGKLTVFVDPHCLQDRPQQPQQNQFAAMSHESNSDLNVLLEKWGVKMEPGKIAADRRLGVMAQFRQGQIPVRFPVYLGLDETCVNADEVIVSDLDTIRMLFAGSLSKVAGARTDVRPLLSTTARGNTWKPGSPFELNMPDPVTINNAVVDGTVPLMLACLITGEFATNFPEGVDLPAAKEEDDEGFEGEDEDDDEDEDEVAADEEPRHVEAVTASAPGATVIVVADVDLITDTIAYTQSFFGMAQSGDNAPLVLNMLDYLGGSEDLIAIRTRGRYSRPFKVVDQIELDAERETEAEVKAINAKIDSYEARLRELTGSATDDTVGLVQNEALAEQMKIDAEIRSARKELRRLQQQRRESVEAVQSSLWNWNLFSAPLIILALAIGLVAFRWARAKSYASRRN